MKASIGRAVLSAATIAAFFVLPATPALADNWQMIGTFTAPGGTAWDQILASHGTLPTWATTVRVVCLSGCGPGIEAVMSDGSEVVGSTYGSHGGSHQNGNPLAVNGMPRPIALYVFQHEGGPPHNVTYTLEYFGTPPSNLSILISGRACIRPALYDTQPDCGAAGDIPATGLTPHTTITQGGTTVPHVIFGMLPGSECAAHYPTQACWSNYLQRFDLIEGDVLGWNLTTPQILDELDPAALAYLSWKPSGGFQTTPVSATANDFPARDFVIDAQLARGTRTWSNTTTQVLGFVIPTMEASAAIAEAEAIFAAGANVSPAQAAGVFGRTIGAAAGLAVAVPAAVVTALFWNPSDLEPAELRFPATGEVITVQPRQTVTHIVDNQLGVQAQSGTVIAVDTLPLDSAVVIEDPAPSLTDPLPTPVPQPFPSSSPSGCAMPALDLNRCLFWLLLPQRPLQVRLQEANDMLGDREPFATIGAGSNWIGQLWQFFTDDELTICIPLLEDQLSAQNIHLTRPCITITRDWTVLGWQPLQLVYGLSTIVIAWLWLRFAYTKWTELTGAN